jgi:hypothetical protein
MIKVHRSDRLFKGNSSLYERHMFAIAHTLLYYETGFCEEHSDEAISQEQPEPPKKDCPELYEKSGEIASLRSQNHFSSFSIRL